MSEFAVKPGELRSLSAMYGDAAGEALKAEEFLEIYCEKKASEYSDDPDRVITVIHQEYARSAEKMQGFLEAGKSTLDGTESMLKRVADAFEETDEDGAKAIDDTVDAEKLSSDIWDHTPGGMLYNGPADVDDIESGDFEYHFTDEPSPCPTPSPRGPRTRRSPSTPSSSKPTTSAPPAPASAAMRTSSSRSSQATGAWPRRKDLLDKLEEAAKNLTGLTKECGSF